ncbi:hypothetical protein [Subtercola endophyticus]|uniref:hypothetical protein n=1 Tax=Subtercola endophyticus TaxID=2895559 RepID=UPI0028BE8832|nr:hypothetical protein [Subtercola endophyticus]
MGWNITTVIGDVSAYGLAAAAAAFLGLLWPRLKHLQAPAVAVAAGLVAALLTPVLAPVCRSPSPLWSRWGSG